MTSLSIIVVTYNSEGVIPSSLRPLRPLLADPGVELVVVDNASDVDPGAVLQRHVERFELIRMTRNEGFAVAVNEGYRHTRGEYVMLLNPDAICAPEVVAELLTRLESDRRIGAMAPLLETPGVETANGGAQPTLTAMASHSTGLARAFARSGRGHYLYSRAVGERSLDVGWVSGGLMVVRRSAAPEGRLLSERWFMYAEDLDLCNWLRARGFRVVLCGDLRAQHAIGGSSGAEAAPRTDWLAALADYYAVALAPRPTAATAALWRTLVAAGYRARWVEATLRRDHTRARRMRAYARAAARPRAREGFIRDAPPLSSRERE